MSKQELQDQIDALVARVANLEAVLASVAQKTSSESMTLVEIKSKQAAKNAVADTVVAAVKRAGDANG